MKTTVVVTGIGMVTPLRPFGNVEEVWRALCSGQDAIRRIPAPMLNVGREWLMAAIDTSGQSVCISSEDKFYYIAEEAISIALNDASFSESEKAGLSIGTVLGNVIVKEKRLMEQETRGLRDQDERESLSHPVRWLAATVNIGRPHITVSTACASGTDAIGIAARRIAAGHDDVMVAGGVDVVSDFAIIGFHVLQALTEEKVRPFDRRRTGLALGEGAAFVILESERHATRRGARVYGRILGYASRADAHHLTGPHREGRGLSDAIGQALAEAKVSPCDVDYINAHGTGTPYNDLMETKAIKKVFGRAAYKVPISSTKSMLGHSFGASGALELICCLLAMRHHEIPPTINFEVRDAECDLDYVPNVSRRHTVSVAMTESAGFGGQNSVIVVGEA